MSLVSASSRWNLGRKQLGLLRELRPGAERIAVLVDPKWPLTERFVSERRAAALAVGQQLVVLDVNGDREIDGKGAASHLKRMSTHELYEIARMPVARALAVDLACLLMDRSRVRFAETRCRLNKRVQNGLQIEGRAADDLEHIGGGGLLLQRFAQLVKQARVLDGDDGLIGEVCDQLDLLLGEWPNFSPIDCNA